MSELVEALKKCRSRFKTLLNVAESSPHGMDPSYCMASYEMLVMIDDVLAKVNK